MENLLIFIIALALDLTMGEPPGWLHPVVGLGKIISLQIRIAPFRKSPYLQFTYGMAMVILTITFFALASYFLLKFIRELSAFSYILAGAYLLKCSLSLKELRKAALRVKQDLEKDDLESARKDIKDLVGRDTTILEKPLLVSAAVESVAENTSDGFVAPLFYFLILGIPGAFAYRIANTYDSMIGYRGKYEYVGKFSARLDDLLNYIPARITGFLISITAPITGKPFKKALKIMLRDHGRTKSPNAGWPMSAAAGALQVQLVKVGHYRLGDEGKAMQVEEIASGVRLTRLASLTWALLALAVIVIRFVWAR